MTRVRLPMLGALTFMLTMSATAGQGKRTALHIPCVSPVMKVVVK